MHKLHRSTTPLYIRDLSIQGVGYPRDFLKPIPFKLQGTNIDIFLKVIFRFSCLYFLYMGVHACKYVYNVECLVLKEVIRGELDACYWSY